MRLEWIEDILAVLDTGSFSAAAERRFLTPSAFTRRIRNIEDVLDCQLFDRARKPVSLLPHVRAMEAELREAARSFRELQSALSDRDGLTRKRLTLGCQHALTTMVSPSLTRSLTQGLDIELRIRSGTRSECQMMLFRHEINFALIYQTDDEATTLDRQLFEKITLGTDQLIPVASLQGNTSMQRAVESLELPLITYPRDIYLGEILRSHLLPALPREAITRRVVETGLTPAVLQFIRQGLGIGWLPRSVAHDALARKELTDLSDRLPSKRLNIHLLRIVSGGGPIAETAWSRLVASSDEIDVAGIEKPRPA